MLTDTPLSAEDVLKINGVAMIVDQGNLDHWFNGDLWGHGSSIRPSGKAFDVALQAGLLEKKHDRDSYRLTNAGRHYRGLRAHAATLARAGDA